LAAPAPVPAYRLKIPCSDEREFRERFAPRYVADGIFIPSQDPKPVGTRVRIKLEIRGGQVLVSGDAMVTSRTPSGTSDKPGMTIRLTALHPESIRFELSPSAASSPALTPAAPAPALTPAPPPLPTAPRALAADDLFRIEDERERPAPPAPPPDVGHPDQEGSAATATLPVPTPVPASPSPAMAAAPLRAGDRRLFVILIAAAAAAVFAGAIAVAAGKAREARAARDAREARASAELRIADDRLRDGRFTGTGGDSALDHLLQARRLAPGDARVEARLRLLADTFEQLGDRAMARKNLGEAAVHFRAAVRADPGRDEVRRKLEQLAASLEAGTTSR
jgi:hypothetical protein